MNILDIEMQSNDARASTIGEYFRKLAIKVWLLNEGFSGKRPFGNSGWEMEIYIALAAAGVIEGTYSEEFENWEISRQQMNVADELIVKALK